MAIVDGILTNTPVWVWALLVYLIVRGIKAIKPGETTLGKLAIIPVLLAVWGVSELVRLFDLTAGNLAGFILPLLAGLGAGYALVARLAITADRTRGVLIRPADYTLLPLVLITFTIKYGFGMLAAVSPDDMQNAWVRLADLAVSGFFVGVFVGKFAAYLAAYLREPARRAEPA